MEYRMEKKIVSENGEEFRIGDKVGVRYNKASGFEGGGFGCATITKITDTGFHYNAGGRRDKSVQLRDIENIRKVF